MSSAWTGTINAALHRAYEESPRRDGVLKAHHGHCRHGEGHGVSFMEHSVLWHYRTARGEEYEAALKELEAGKP